MKILTKKTKTVITTSLLIALFSTASLLAQENQRQIDLEAIFRGTPFYDEFDDTSCSADFGVGDFSKVSPEILTRIKEHEPIYKQVSVEKNIPWELLATLHYREASGLQENPRPAETGPLRGVGQGAYQLYSWILAGRVDPFEPIGPIDDAEFLRQTRLAADFMLQDKDAARRSSGVTKDLELKISGNDPRVIKELLFYYNGASPIYIEQAMRVGKIDPWEGSPYVMNFASPLQSPDNFPDWRQVREDTGPPIRANGETGGWLVFSAISGQSCDNPDGNSILDIAQAELKKMVAELVPGPGLGDEVSKYTQGQNIPWGPAFVSWVYNESGNPLPAGDTGDWLIPSGQAMKDAFTVNNSFFTADQDEPKPGDVVFIETPNGGLVLPQIEVYIVDRIEANTLFVIGGDIGDKVQERQLPAFQNDDSILGFGSQTIGAD